MVQPTRSEGGTGSGREHALLSLRAIRHPDWIPFLRKAGVDLLPPQEAVAQLSGQVLDPLPRLQILHDLGATGRLEEMREPALQLAEDLIYENKFDDLIELAQRPGLSFRSFVEEVNAQGISSQALMAATAESCTADPIENTPNPPTRIVATFEAPGVLADFAYGADPLNWPQCNPFFLEMTTLGPKAPLPIDNVDGTAYAARVKEVVGIAVLWEIRTNLDVRYFVASNAVGMDFNFAGGDGQIDVDHGYVIVEPHPSRANWVTVRAQKTVHFANMPNFPATLACFLGWIHVMRSMATCRPPN